MSMKLRFGALLSLVLALAAGAQPIVDGADVWYKFAPTVTDDYTLSLPVSFRGVTLAWFDGSAIADAEGRKSVQPQHHYPYVGPLSLSLVAGQEYYFRVAGLKDGNTFATGSFEILLAQALPEGEGDVEVPDLTGLTVDQAEEVLNAVGLEYTVVYEYSDTVPAGQIIRQEPAPGETVPSGTSITIYVSLGPLCVPEITAADAEVLCEDFADAQDAIEEIFANVTADDGCDADLTANIRVRYITWEKRRDRLEYLKPEELAAKIDGFGEYDYTVAKTQKLFHYLLLFRPGTYTVFYELLDNAGNPYDTFETTREQRILIEDECGGCLGCLGRTGCSNCRAQFIPESAGDLKRMLSDWLLTGLSLLLALSWMKISRP